MGGNAREHGRARENKAGEAESTGSLVNKSPRGTEEHCPPGGSWVQLGIAPG